MTIEIYDMEETEPYRNGFRLTYQGKPITQNISGCVSGSDICDISVLLDKYPSGTDWKSYCSQEVPSPTTEGDLLNWDFALGIIVGVACCAGIFITLLVITRFRKKIQTGYTALN